MTDKPKVNTDCMGRGGGEGGREGRRGEEDDIFIFIFPVNPSLKFTDFRSESKKFKTNANCLNKLSFELLKYMTGRGGWEQ